MTINSKCGSKAVQLIKNGGREDDIIAIAVQNSFDSETMSNTSYWFTVGHYKSEKTAIRQSAKKLAQYGYELATV